MTLSSDHQRSANRLACRHMERASVLEPEPEPPTTGHSQRISTGDSKNGGGSSPSWVSEVASSEGSFATLRAWLERNEQEYTSASEAKDRAGSSSSQENKAASSTASFTTLRAWLDRIEQEKTSASEAKLRAGVPSSHGKTANSTKASFASLRRPEHDAYDYDDHSEGGEFSAQSMKHPLPPTTFSQLHNPLQQTCKPTSDRERRR